MFCTNCGTQNPNGARFCSNCGAPIGAPAQQFQQPARSQWSAPDDPWAGQSQNDRRGRYARKTRKRGLFGGMVSARPEMRLFGIPVSLKTGLIILGLLVVAAILLNGMN